MARGGGGRDADAFGRNNGADFAIVLAFCFGSSRPPSVVDGTGFGIGMPLGGVTRPRTRTSTDARVQSTVAGPSPFALAGGSDSLSLPSLMGFAMSVRGSLSNASRAMSVRGSLSHALAMSVRGSLSSCARTNVASYFGTSRHLAETFWMRGPLGRRWVMGTALPPLYVMPPRPLPDPVRNTRAASKPTKYDTSNRGVLAIVDGVSDPLGMLGVVLAEKFRVERLLGEGGHGVVYGGTHLLLNAPIAVKFLKVESAGAEQFVREARILFSLSHPAIVRMYDVGELARGSARMPWVVLELLSGPTLEAEIAIRRAQRRHFSAAELHAIFAPVLDGLAFAHARGVTHRDIKPANILLSRPSPGREEPKLLDFGTARSQAVAFQAAAGNTGFTPLYAAPEQWDSSIAPASAATDVYSTALTMLECATLERAYGTAGGVGELLRSVMSGTGRPQLRASRPDLAPALDEVLDRAMAIYPTARFRDAGELRVAVEQALLATTMPSAAAAAYSPSGAPAAYSPSGAPAAYSPSAPPPYVPSGPQLQSQNTSSPFVQSQPKPKAPQTSSAGVVFMVLSVIGGIVVVVGLVLAIGVAAIVAAFTGKAQETETSIATPPPETTVTPPEPPEPPEPTEPPAPETAPSAAPSARTPASSASASKGAWLSKGVVEVDDKFDMANAARVTQSHYPDIDACFQRSQKWKGELVISLKVRTRDGRVVGSTCKTKWHEDDPAKAKHLPKLDPRASEFCGCVQTKTPAWAFAKPKGDEGALFDVDDANDLDVTYAAE